MSSTCTACKSADADGRLAARVVWLVFPQATPASDLYSLGATLLYLVSGQPPGAFPQKRMRIDYKYACGPLALSHLACSVSPLASAPVHDSCHTRLLHRRTHSTVSPGGKKCRRVWLGSGHRYVMAGGASYLRVWCCRVCAGRDKVTVGPRLSELLDSLLEPLAEDRVTPQEALDIVTGERSSRQAGAFGGGGEA